MLREALQEARDLLFDAGFDLNNDGTPRAEFAVIEQALAAEPAPLVRLTEQEAKKAYEKGELDAIEKGIESASHGLGLREVIDEMIAKNGGKV